MTALIIQHPRSLTNPTDRYRVCEYEEWLRVYNGEATSYEYIEVDNYDDALLVRDA